jgi:hypothetical protein
MNKNTLKKHNVQNMKTHTKKKGGNILKNLSSSLFGTNKSFKTDSYPLTLSTKQKIQEREKLVLFIKEFLVERQDCFPDTKNNKTTDNLKEIVRQLVQIKNICSRVELEGLVRKFSKMINDENLLFITRLKKIGETCLDITIQGTKRPSKFDQHVDDYFTFIEFDENVAREAIRSTHEQSQNSQKSQRSQNTSNKNTENSTNYSYYPNGNRRVDFQQSPLLRRDNSMNLSQNNTRQKPIYSQSDNIVQNRFQNRDNTRQSPIYSRSDYMRPNQANTRQSPIYSRSDYVYPSYKPPF